MWAWADIDHRSGDIRRSGSGYRPLPLIAAKTPESVRDLGREPFRMSSANPTRVNETRVAPHSLCAGLMLDLGRTSLSNLAGKTRVAGSWDAAAACSALANAEEVSADTNEMATEYGRPKFPVNVSHSLGGHHVNASHLRCAQARSMPEAALGSRRGRRSAEALTATSTARRSGT
jgi:hypothetical protein